MIPILIILTMSTFLLITWLDHKFNTNDDFDSVQDWHNFQGAFDKKRKP
jgi:hypothetical protein